MAKLKLVPDPTFKAKVPIPVPGGKTTPVEFTFRYRNADEMAEFGKTLEGREDLDLMLDIASGWDLAEPFDKDNVGLLLKSYAGCAWPILRTYMDELNAAKEKN